MNAFVDVSDERRPGTARELRHRLELPEARVTARDLIRCRIEAKVALHNAAECDDLLSIILSKAALLAAYDKITDPTILSQIGR
jgi:hypothetical protein